VMEFEEHRKRTSLQRFARWMFQRREVEPRARQARPENPPANRMVPSDPLRSLAPHRHARLELRQSGPRDVVLSAPRLSVFEKSASTL
jgi:hypothetical protein